MMRITKLLLLSFGILVTLSSCLREECDAVLTYTGYEPVYVYPEDFRVDIEPIAARDICTPAGFYYYQDYLMVVEKNEGLHLINNSNPASPRSVAFLPVKGALGLSVQSDVLYINNVTDLVTFDLSNPTAPSMLGRTEDVFTAYGAFGQGFNVDGAIVIDYVETELTQFISCTDVRSNNWGFWSDDVFFIRNNSPFAEGTSFVADLNSSSTPSGTSAGGDRASTGVGGSLARFTINNGTLYAVEDDRLVTFNIADPANPVRTSPIQLPWGVETIFPYGDLLFIGTNRGMHIFDGSDPLSPVQLSTFEHVQSCDPVYVNGDLAYVTLRSGPGIGWCNNNINRLEIVDVSDPSNPSLVEAYDMNFPAGLTVTDEMLFLCEGDHGFKVFDLQPNGLLGDQIAERTDISALDVIGLHWLQQLITIDETGLSQLSYDTDGQLEDLSTLTICDN